MGFTVVCLECGTVLYEGWDMIPFYQLRNKTDGKCPNCGRCSSLRPLSIQLQERQLITSLSTEP